MRLFLDTSVLLAAAGSARGASRFLFENAEEQGWKLLSSTYCLEETKRNLHKLGAGASSCWHKTLAPRLTLVRVELSFHQALVFHKSKDRPVLLSAIGARADLLLTLDEADFQRSVGDQVYSLSLRSPGRFLAELREAGRI